MTNWRRNVDVVETDEGPLYIYDKISEKPFPPCSTTQKCLDDVMETMKMFHNTICYVGSEEYWNRYEKVVFNTLWRLRQTDLGPSYSRGELEVAVSIAEDLLAEEYHQDRKRMIEFFGLPK